VAWRVLLSVLVACCWFLLQRSDWFFAFSICDEPEVIILVVISRQSAEKRSKKSGFQFTLR